MMIERIRYTMAQALITFLDNQYVEFDGKEYKFIEGMFGIFGHGCVLGIGQALQEPGNTITFYQGHNEQNMAHAAIAYAKENKRLKILPCVASIGPGALNMVTAAGTATVNRIPLLLLPGDTFASRQPDPVLQQLENVQDITLSVNDAFKAVTTYWDRIMKPEQLMISLLKAFSTLTSPSQTGAVALCLPQDVQAQAYDYPVNFFRKRVWKITAIAPQTQDVEYCVEQLRHAKQPLLIVGGGAKYAKAHKILDTLTATHSIPFATTQAGGAIIESEHPMNLGGIGVTGTGLANRYAAHCDLIITLGTRLQDFTTASKSLFSDDVLIINVNIHEHDTLKLDGYPILSDARLFLEELHQQLPDDDPIRTSFDQLKNEWETIVDNLCMKTEFGPFAQTRILALLNHLLDHDGIVVSASGSLPSDLQRLWYHHQRDTYHVEYGFSCMGYEINGGLGVKMANPNRQVNVLVGDGSYLMGHSELLTSIQEDLKLNIFVFDNGGWGCIEALQNAQGSLTFGTVFKKRNPNTNQLNGNPLLTDFAMNARSYGAKGYTINNEVDLVEAIEHSKTQTCTCVFDIKVSPKTMTDAYDALWRVGVSDISSFESVRKASKAMRDAFGNVRDI